MSKASVYFTLGKAAGKHDRKEIKQGLETLSGVLSVSVSEGSSRVAVDFDTTATQSGHIQKQLETMGYEVFNSKSENHIM